MYSDHLLMDKFAEEFGALKLSALTSANKIKPFVKKVTIGPNASGEEEIRVTLTEITENVKPGLRPSIKSRLGPKIPAAENVDYRDETDASLKYQKSQYPKNINIDMLKYETDKINRNAVRRKVHAFQARFAKSEQERQSKSDEEFRARQYFLNKRFEQIESDILQDLEKHQQVMKLQQQQKIQEQKEQCQILQQKTLALRHEQEIRNQRLKKKEELDAIYISQKLFREAYENFLHELKSFNNSTAQQVFTEHSSKLKVLISSMEELTHKCSAGNTNAEHVSQAQHLVTEMKKLCNTIMLEYRKLQEAQQLEEQRKLEQIAKEKETKNQSPPPVINQNIKEPPAYKETQVQQLATNREITNEETEFGTLDNWRKIADYQNFISEFATKYEQVKQDTSLKKFRFNCQKAVNIPVNTIAGKGASHTEDKLAKLDALLAGQMVQIGDMQICAGQHPQGVSYCHDLLAKSIVKQGGILSGNPESAIPIAYVTVALWSKYPDFGKLVLGYFYEKCPYLAPVHPARTSDMTEEEYLRIQGYEVSPDGVLETKDLFLKRLNGLGRLYFALTIVKASPGVVHPWGLQNSWTWLASTLNLAPVQDISATLVLQCLEVTGFSQINHYKKQFWKILQVIAREYVPELDKVCHGGPKARLKEFLIKTLQIGAIEPPKEITYVPDIDYL